MINTNSMCGIAKVEGEIKDIIFNPLARYRDKKVKELVYGNTYNEVEGLIGFRDLDIVEISPDDSILSAVSYLLQDEDVVGVIFLKEGYLVVQDLVYFSGYTIIDGVREEYKTDVESVTYEEAEAEALIEEDLRLA